ncbi:MAG TPA: hypothetical protein VNX27_08975 [Chthoniobacterales bacterium]|nr:hypothetical protein [Chthoniobacterales bacterium]
MPKQTAYFDSQASAAAALKIDIYELREAKRQGCPAFRSGRVYGDEYLDWRQARELQTVGSVAANGIGIEEGRSIIAQTIRLLIACANLGVLTPDQSFDFCRTIVEAADDPDLREVFRRTLGAWVEFNFSEIAEAKARKAHPKVMSWLRSENKAWFRREYGSSEFETKTQANL